VENLIKNKNTGIFKYCVGTVVVLILLKTVVSFRTSSLGLLSSAVDSCLDLFTSLVNWFSFIQSEKPADKEHPYGHGKIESLASLFQSLVISTSAFYLLYEAFSRYQQGFYQIQTTEALGAMCFSLGATFFLVQKLSHLSKESHSLILKAEALHFQSDLWSGLGILFSLLLVHLTQQVFFDVLITLFIAFSILFHSWNLLLQSVDQLIDRALPEEEVAPMKEFILKFNPHICSFHHFRSRRLGTLRFIDVHIEIRGIHDFQEAHELTESLIRAMKKEFHDSDILVHYDPEGAE
jgi:ferrous-iron efflux pump FieF